MTRIWTGTASVVNGDATVVLTGDPLSDANCPADASIVLGGASYFVLSRTNTTTLELTRNYAGTTSASVAAEIDPLNPAALSVVNATLLAARVQAQLNVLDKNSQGLFYTLLGITGSADPGPGKLALNNVDPTLITAFYIDNIDANNRAVDGIIDLWTAGTIIIIRSLTSTAYVALRVPSGVVNSTGFRTATCAYIDHDGILATGEAISVSYAKIGEGLKIDAAGVYSGRAAHDAAAAGYVYLSTNGAAGSGGASVLYIKNSATSGDWSPAGTLQGDAGANGWSPTFALANDGARRVLQLTGYAGGTGAAPTADIGKYVSASGYTSTIASAMDIRGSSGVSPTIGIGTVTPLASGSAPTVANGGSSSAVVLNFGLPVPNNGSNGVNGADGTDPGILLIWDDGNTLANPGAGKLRASDDALGSATWLAISKSNRAGNDISAFLATLDDSSNPTRKGLAVLTRSGGNAQATFDVTGITDHTGYAEVAIANFSGATGFLNNDLISFQFVPAGDRGASGSGTGSVNGPVSSVVHRLAAFADTSGALLEDTGKVVGDFVQATNNGSDFASKQATYDNLSIDGADIASAATVNLETASGSFVAITGTTATSVITLSDGHRRRTLAAAAWPITVGASLVVNNAGANYTCAAGDIIDWVADGTVIRGTIYPISGIMPGVNAAIAAYVAAQDVEVLKGAIDCSTNPNYPAADAGHVYRVSVAGKIGGASGVNVEVGDRLECFVDSTAAGNQATVGANWLVSQVNIDGAVTGPATSTSGNLASFNGSAGRTIQDSGKTVSIDGTLASNSDNKIPTEKAVKTYVDGHAAAGPTLGTSWASTSGSSHSWTPVTNPRQITINFAAVSTSGTSNWTVRIGTGGAPTTTGYLGSGGFNGTASVFTNGFTISAGNASTVLSGQVILTLLDASTNVWACTYLLGRSDGTAGVFIGGYSKALTGTLDTVQIATVNGTDTFDAGIINVVSQ